MTVVELPPMVEARMRTQISAADLKAKVGKVVTPRDYNMLLTGPARIVGPSGRLLAVYLPGVLSDQLSDAYDVLHGLRTERTDNRGDASGTPRLKRGDQKRTRSSLVSSAIIGATDPGGTQPYCRLTSWTGRHLPEWEALHPLLRTIDGYLAAAAPDRYAAQAAQAALVSPEWVVPGTTFTTVTVNNTYSTGVHQDAGDLEAGFSTLAVARRGEYTGGVFVLVRYRIGVDMQHGDLLLLDAHEHHGNTAIVPDPLGGERPQLDYERISLVAYMRARMVNCGTADEERAKALANADRRSGRVE